MRYKNYIKLFGYLLIGLLLINTSVYSQKKSKKNNLQTYNSSLHESVEYREIGPFRGGRSAAVVGVSGNPDLFYFGATGGGVWKTTNGGETWKNISDGFFGGSIGSIAISKSDPNIIFAGGGEVTVRGNVSSGYGVWKSVDAGKTWKSSGLPNSRHIPRIVIDPKNPDIVYTAVLGNIYKPTNDRGVYKSIDGGQNWEKILFSNEHSGAVELVMDPNNSRNLFASTWRMQRTPYSLSSGGEGSALWKSTDSGKTWGKINNNKGFPEGIIGIIGVTVSPVNSDRVWAIIENKEKGGVYRSDDAGKTWSYLNDSRSLRQRAWYYSKIYADTEDINGVYIMNVRYHHSTDGGKTFKANNAPHGDHHDLWIAPEDNQRMIIADDGGAQVTYDGGKSWSTYYNQPTAQYYRVTTDNAFPYRIYVAQQDNSTQRVGHRSFGRYITENDWEPTAGSESAHIAVDPINNEIAYGGNYLGFLNRLNHDTKSSRPINVWPENTLGDGVEKMKYRFQWNFPIVFSKHNPKRLYTFSNHVHVTEYEGQSWELISPDLTRNDPSKLQSSGGPEWMMINSIDASPFDEGTAYVAGTRYKLGDFTPYLYRTDNYGKSWKLITDGIESEHFTRVVRSDKTKKGLLYSGTETGMYISFNDGKSWEKFQKNLPIVPITDLTIKDNSLIVATQGRSLWIIDDLTVIHQLDKNDSELKLYNPKDAYSVRGAGGNKSLTAGTNLPNGVILHYYIPEYDKEKDEIMLSFHSKDGQEIKSYGTKDKENKLEVKKGGNNFVWNMRHQGAEVLDGMILWAANFSGAKAIPGEYIVKLKHNDVEISKSFNILQSPISEASIEDMQLQFEFINEINSMVDNAHKSIKKMRSISKKLKRFQEDYKEVESAKGLIEEAKSIVESFNKIENEIHQTKSKSNQDPLNFGIKLNNKLGHLNALVGSTDFRPTDQSVLVKEDLTQKLNVQLSEFEEIISKRIPAFNREFKSLELEYLIE